MNKDIKLADRIKVLEQTLQLMNLCDKFESPEVVREEVKKIIRAQLGFCPDCGHDYCEC